MMELKCLRRLTDNKGIITEYLMCDHNGQQRVFLPEELKKLIRSGHARCVNLTLTKDNRLLASDKAIATVRGNDSRLDNMSISSTMENTAQSVSCIEQLKQHLMRQKLMGLQPDAEYVIDKKSRVLLKAVYVSNGTYIIPSFVSGIYRRSSKSPIFRGNGVIKVINNSNIKDMACLFAYCGASILDLSDFDTSRVVNMQGMFAYCTDLIKILMGKFDTSKVVNMHNMFLCCEALEEVDVSGFNTSQVKDMAFMFSDCCDIKTLDVSNWNTSNVTTMCSMFSGCQSLDRLDLHSFDTARVTDMYSMFRGTQLETYDLSSFNTFNVTSMGCMFQDCMHARSINLSHFDTSNVTDMSYMFNISGLFRNPQQIGWVDINVRSFNTSKVTQMIQMFANCDNLRKLDLSSFKVSPTAKVGGMLYGCNYVRSFTLSQDLDARYHELRNCSGN